jgi:2',3'-cyclic-nucleotide 2'-phosphodiesterase (5'-nucleotidase family)
MRVLLLLLLTLTGCTAAEEPGRTLTILHVNDLHARLSPDEHGRGGFARLAGAIERECAAVEACLVLDAGDLVQGTPVSSLFRGVPIFEVANGLGLDASTLGNHEFDYGRATIDEYVETAEFPLVTANVDCEPGGTPADAPFVVLEKAGIRVGVIGVLTASLPNLTTPDNYAGCRLTEPADAVRELLPGLRSQAELIVVLGHLTGEEESAVAAVAGIAAVVSGHDHSGLREPLVVDGRPVVRVAAYGRELGRLDLLLDGEQSVHGWRWKKIPVNPRTATADPETEQSVASWESKVAEIVDVPIGRSRERLKQPEVRALLERALREATGADLGYVNRGGVRDGIPAGDLLARHLWNVMPFDNHVVVGEFRGRDLPRSLVEERGLDRDRSYRLATMDYVATMWNRNRRKPLRFDDTGDLVRDVAIDWVRNNSPLEKGTFRINSGDE